MVEVSHGVFPLEFVCKSRAENRVQCVTNGAENLNHLAKPNIFSLVAKVRYKHDSFMSFTLKQAIFTINLSKFEQRFQISSEFKLNKGMTLSKSTRFYFEYEIEFQEPIGVSGLVWAGVLFVL